MLAHTHIDPARYTASAPAHRADANALAIMAKAAADPLRLAVLRVLRDDSLGVSELCRLFDVHQPTMSHHLKVLAAAALITPRREGNHSFYRRLDIARDAGSEPLHDGLLQAVDRLALPAAVQAGLAAVRQERSQNSLAFFRTNAEKFREQQDLIASHSDYGVAVAELLQQAHGGAPELAVEIGPGDGAFLELLSPQFRRVLALDNSPEMLAQAATRVAAAGLDNIELTLGDTRHPCLNGLGADCIVVNMVLHHTAAPPQILSDLARALSPTGTLLVTDLCRHDQAWAQSSCGDLWLGFEPRELRQWAAAAGLHSIGSELLAQRNGFQIQIHLFRHAP